MKDSPASFASSEVALRRRGFRNRHLVMLGVSCSVLLMSFALEVVPEGRVAVRGFESHPLPHSCGARVWLGASCPGCGLTRGFIHLANGRVEESLAIHRLAWLMALVVLLQIPYRLAGLLGGNPAPLGSTFPRLFGCTLVVLLLANWFYEVLKATI